MGVINYYKIKSNCNDIISNAKNLKKAAENHLDDAIKELGKAEILDVYVDGEDYTYETKLKQIRKELMDAYNAIVNRAETIKDAAWSKKREEEQAEKEAKQQSGS